MSHQNSKHFDLLDIFTINNGHGVRLQNSCVGYLNFFGRFSGLRSDFFDLSDKLHPSATFASFDTAEHNVLSVEPRSFGGAKEELGAVSVGSSVGHAQDARPSVFQCEVLVLELVSVDGLASSAVPTGEVSSLTHEPRNHSVELGALETESLFASAQGPEVLRGFGNHLILEFHLDPAGRSTSYFHVEETGGTWSP